MRDIDSILADVIEALEPRESLPIPESPIVWSPLGLWLATSFSRMSWAPVLTLDTGTLIDAARKTGRAHVTLSTGDDKVWASTHDGSKSWEFRDTGGEAPTPTREMIILALALALGVETEG